MLSKWIKDLTKAIFYGKDETGESPDSILDNIDKLLKEAALDTDNESLHDRIMAKIKDDAV